MFSKFFRKKYDNLNMTAKEYANLTAEERIKLNEKLKWMSWHDYSEVNPNIERVELPCVINGTLILG